MHLWGWGEEHHEGVEGGHDARRGDKIMKEQGEGSKKKECMKDHGVRVDHKGEGGHGVGGWGGGGGEANIKNCFSICMYLSGTCMYISIQQPVQSCSNACVAKLNK